MSKNKIKQFFEQRAKCWDIIHKQCDYKTALEISLIPKNTEGKIVLDVGSGTGILIPFLLARFQKVYAVDISSKMLKILKKKYPLVTTLCCDFENNSFFKKNQFDCVFAYNCFPHFESPEKFIEKSFALLKKTGMLIIAHSMPRKELNLTHKKAGGIVSNHILLESFKLKKLLNKAGFRKIKIIEKNNFILTATKDK